MTTAPPRAFEDYGQTSAQARALSCAFDDCGQTSARANARPCGRPARPGLVVAVAAAAAAAACLLVGCATPLGLAPASAGEQFRQGQTSALTSDALSIRTVQILEREGFPPTPDESTAAALRVLATSEMDADRLVALAEVSFALARRAGFSTDLGWQHSLVAAVASWAALFSPAADLSPFQSRASLARHLHNASLTTVTLGIPDLAGVADVDIRRTVFGREIALRSTWRAATWNPERFTGFAAADDFRVRGLRNRHRQSGVGAALLGERGPIDPAAANATDYRLPPMVQAVALTSIMQDVTLGGTGKESGDRHPKIRRGVLLSLGAKILGNIEIGEYSRVGAGSVVLKSVPPHCTAVGVPAKLVNCDCGERPSHQMDHFIEELPDNTG